MALDIILKGTTTGNGQEVTVNNRAKVELETNAIANATQIGGVRMFSEVDQGYVTGAPLLLSPEADADYRMRVAVDNLLETHNFCHTSQDTAKHNMLATTLVPSFTLGAFNTNPTSLTTSAAGVQLRTYATFPIVGTGTTVFESEGAFTATPTTNCIVEFGGGLLGAAVANSPIDGAFFRLTSAGMQGVVTYNGTETTSSVFKAISGGVDWTYTLNKRYQFIVYIYQRNIQFWINDGSGALLYANIPCPVGNPQPVASASLPFFVRQYHTAAAGAALSFALGAYSVRVGGPDLHNKLGENLNSFNGGYQGLSGGTLGSLMSGTVTTGSVVPPTAAVPTNTTAALGTGLGGTFYETVSLAVATDGIITSFQVPALPTVTAATYGAQKRLKISGVSIGSFVQTVVAGGPYNARYYLAFGHTAVSLQTAESATTKAPRRVMLPFVQTVTAAQAVSTAVAQNLVDYKFANPIYVNPGEFIALVTTHTGTAGTTGVVAHQVAFDYAFE